MATRRQKRDRPSIYLDEYIHPEVARIFGGEFRTVETTKTRSLAGWDERKFLPELCVANGIFATNDREFGNEAINCKRRHAGIIYAPASYPIGRQVYFASVMSAWISASARRARFPLRGQVFYPDTNGVHLIESDRDKIVLSWHELNHAKE